MKKIIYLICVALAFIACQSEKKTVETKTDYVGVYKSTFPCADCPGIEVSLTLNKDKTFVYEKVYLDKEDGRFVDKGKYSVKENILRIEEGKKPTYFSIEENTLVLLDDEMKPSASEFLPYYRLKKRGKFEYVGKYETYSESEDAYKQTLAILKEGEKYKVDFSASKVKGRENCHFSGIATLKRDTLWVNIANESDKEILMYIAPSHDNLGVEVFTPDFEERYQMMLYCKGGSSLAGKYLKNTITAKSISVFKPSTRIKDILNTVPLAQIHKKIGYGEFKEDLYDDYQIYTHNNQHLFTLTPKDTANIEQKVNRVLIKSLFFKTDKGINCKSTYRDIKNAYTITKIEPTRKHVVLTVAEINATFSIPKTVLQKGWWNPPTKTVNPNKIPDTAQIESFILWWK